MPIPRYSLRASSDRHNVTFPAASDFLSSGGHWSHGGNNRRSFAKQAGPHRGGLLPEPLGVPLVLTVLLHLLRPEGHAAVAVEVQAVVAAHIGPLLLQLPVLRLQELRQARLGPLGSAVGKGKAVWDAEFFLTASADLRWVRLQDVVWTEMVVTPLSIQ